MSPLGFAMNGCVDTKERKFQKKTYFPAFSGQLTIRGTFICLADKGVLVSLALVFDL